MMKSTLICLALVFAAADAANVSPVQKVIQLIEDMETKVSAEGKAAEDDFAQYAKWCDGEADEKERAIKDTSAEISDLDATIADATAQITNLESKIAELTSSISSTEKELADATKGRDGQHTDFVSAEDELVGTVDTLGHDAQLIKKEMGGGAFMQMPQARREKLQKLVKGLDSVVEAGWVTTQEKKTVGAFLQQKDEAEDEQEPAAYESSSGGILDAIDGMQEKAEESLSAERKQEMKDQNGFALLKMALTNEIKGLKEELAKATSKKQFTTQEMAGAGKTLTSAKSSLAEDQKYLADLKRECQAKAAEFEEEYKDRVNELGALGKAKAIMTDKFAFVQTGMTVRVRSHNWMTERHEQSSEADERKEKALRVLHNLGKQMKSTVLVSLSYRALADPFAKVKNMIEEMVSKLLAEAAEEADHKAFCDKELGETNASKETKEGKLDTVNSRIAKAESSVEKLGEETKTLGAEVAEIDRAVAEATAIRNEEKATFEKAAKDFSESQEACAAAIEVLRSYYESGSFVQVSSRTTLKSKARMTTKDGGGIIGMLEVAESDFSKLLSEARAAEEAAVTEYTTMTNDSKVLKATKVAENKAKKTEMANIKMALENYGDDKAGLDSELSAVVEYLGKLKPQCEYQVPTYEERKLRREKEINGLKEALSVLEGDAV